MNWENYCPLDGLTAVRLGYKWLTFMFSTVAGTRFPKVKKIIFNKFTHSVF